jgi:hypothetical protein
MEYLNAGANLGTGYTSVVSAATTTKYLVKTIHATNVFSADTSFHCRWNDDSTTGTTFLAFNVTIPQSASFQALDGTFVLDNLDDIEAKCGNAAAVDLTISYLEITNAEG